MVFNAAEEATSPGKGKLHLNFKTEVIETNNNARSDREGGRAAHMQPLKERADGT